MKQKKIVQVKKKKIIHERIGYNMQVLFAIIVFFGVGLYLLIIGHKMLQNSWQQTIAGAGVMGFGWIILIGKLDRLYVILHEDYIEIKSLFRQRKIFKKDIIGFGIEEYTTRHVSGERLRIVANNSKSFKFLTQQMGDFKEIIKYLKGVKKLKDAFKKERQKEDAFAIFVLICGLSALIYCLW